MLYIAITAVIGLVIVAVIGFRTIEANVLVAAQERENLSMAHASQLAELCNRIQLPERAAHVSISDNAPPAEPYIDPDYAEELSILATA